MTRTFRRTIEDFTCAACGHAVRGNGYTNHCPQCLWSRHVDVNPGDRRASCRGMMEPVGIRPPAGGAGARAILTHQCAACGMMRNNMAAADDDTDAIGSLSALAGTHE